MKSDKYNSYTKTLVSGGIVTLSGNFLGRILGFIINILLTRYLGAVNFGTYSLGKSLYNLLFGLSNLGLNKGITRYVAIYRGENDIESVKGIFLSAIKIGGIFSLIISILIISFSNVVSVKIFDNSDLNYVLKLFGIALPFNIFFSLSLSFFVANLKIKYYQKVQNLCQPLLQIFFLIIVFLLGYRLKGAVFGFFLSIVVSALVVVYYLYKLFPELFNSIKPRLHTNVLIKYALQVLLTGFSYLLLNNVDRLMLGYYSDSYNVGVYSAASSISVLITFILTGLIPVFSPMAADFYNKGKLKELSKIYSAVTRWAFTLTIPIFLIFFFLSTKVMMIFGEDFVAGGRVLMVLSTMQLINVGTGPVGNLLEMTGKQYIVLYTSIITVTLNILLNYLLIPLYGAIGAAVATLISVSSVFLILVFFIKIKYSIKPFSKYFYYSLLAAIGAVIISYFLGGIFKFNLFNGESVLGGIILIISYIILLFIMGFDDEDKNLMRMVLIKSFGLKNK